MGSAERKKENVAVRRSVLISLSFWKSWMRTYDAMLMYDSC